MTDDDGVALRRAVLENPLDDTVRLVYADWLEEHDDPDRAHMIRAQVNKPHLFPDRDLPPEAKFDPDWNAAVTWLHSTAAADDYGPAADGHFVWKRAVHRLGPVSGFYRRGFVSDILVTYHELAHKNWAMLDVFRKHPVVRFTFAAHTIWPTPNDTYRDSRITGPSVMFRPDTVPSRRGVRGIYFVPQWAWPDTVPTSGAHFKSYDEAMWWLSDAIVTAGRRMYGLPPVEFPDREYPHWMTPALAPEGSS